MNCNEHYISHIPKLSREIPMNRAAGWAVNRRRHRRSYVPGVAVVSAEDGSVAVSCVRDISLGGACLTGNTVLVAGKRSNLTLYLAGAAPLEVSAKVIRRQLATRRGQCAIAFDDLAPA